MDYYEIRKYILRKLLHLRKTSRSRTTEVRNLLKGLSRSVWGTKDAKNAVKDLIKENLLITKPTGHGVCAFINREKIKEIFEEIEGT